MAFLQPAEIHLDVYLSKSINLCQLVDVKMPVLDVLLAVILCMTVFLAEVYTLLHIYIQMYFCRL